MKKLIAYLMIASIILIFLPSCSGQDITQTDLSSLRIFYGRTFPDGDVYIVSDGRQT